ncbi:hypothetical protein [Enterocloster sp.]
MSEQKEKIGFTVACVSEFAQQHNISVYKNHFAIFFNLRALLL